MTDLKPIFTPRKSPMRVCVFSSQGPGNFSACLHAASSSPKDLEVCLLVSDRAMNPSILLAEEKGIPSIKRCFSMELTGLKGESRREKCDDLHSQILEDIQKFEQSNGRIDLCVLAYRRIIRGALLEYFRDRMINQHPADLSSLNAHGERLYTGIGGLARSIADGVRHTRTSTILVSEKVDGGEILIQGPWAELGDERPVDVIKHEQMQKKVSDWPAITKALLLISTGRLSIGKDMWHDGCRHVFLDETRVGYCGVQLIGDS